MTSVAGVYLSRTRALPAATLRILLLAAANDTGALSILARAAAALGLDVDDLSPAEGAGLVGPGKVGFFSAILWSARPFTTTPRPTPGARSTALWLMLFRTSRRTGALGTWPSPCAARTMLPARLWSRPAPGRGKGALTTWLQGLSSAPPS